AQIQQLHEKWCDKNGEEESSVLAEFLPDDEEADSFWDKVEANLRSDKLRLVFIGDEIPEELQSIIEFLNRQMRSVEVLGIEVRQYAGDGLRTLVPRIIGNTVSARAAKSSGIRAQREWDRESFVAELRQRRGEEESRIGDELIDWFDQLGARTKWGTGPNLGSY